MINKVVGSFDEAVADYDRLVRIEPKNADAYNNRGYAHQQNGDRVKAIADYRRALTLNPGHVQARANFEALKAAR